MKEKGCQKNQQSRVLRDKTRNGIGDRNCKWISMVNGYKYFLYPYINGTTTCIIVFVFIDIRTHYTLI